MKIKLGEIVSQLENIRNLLENKLPVKVAYRLNKLSKKLDSELKSYNETKNAIVLELAKDLPDPTRITEENPVELAEYNKKHKELLEEEVEIDFEKIKVEELGEVVVSPNELVDWIFI